MMWMMLQWVHAALAVDKARAWPQEQKLGSNHSSRSGAAKAEKEIAIVNRRGLHARPAARFVQAANRFRADVWVEKGSTQVNGKSILGLMMLGANCHPLAQSCGACARCLSGPALPDPEATLRRPCDASRVSRNGAALFRGYGLGGIAERALVHENQLAVVPKELPFAQAALLGCGVVTGAGSVLDTANVSAGDTVVIFGAGGVGLNAGSGARIAGASRIVVIDIQAQHLDEAERFGATDIIPIKTKPVEAVRNLLPGGADHVFDFVGLKAVAEQGSQCPETAVDCTRSAWRIPVSRSVCNL